MLVRVRDFGIAHGDRFRIPKAQGRVAVVNAARGFARDAEPLAKAFIAHGMPEDFVARLNARIAGVEQTLHDREAGKELNASARASMKTALESGLRRPPRLRRRSTRAMPHRG